jgi:DNA repair photolyase
VKPKLKVIVAPLQGLIKKAPGFQKKELAEYKIDVLALCEFGCRYCSSNMGNYQRINREPFADLTEEQLGVRLYPGDSPELTMHFPNVVEQLARELADKPKSYGAGKTLVFSMLTDGLSPSLVKDGTSRAVLELLLEHTSFRIRVLTKNAIVGNADWLSFLRAHRDRFVAGLSIGTLDDEWAEKIEIGTSRPTARLRALRQLQDGGVATFGMLCPLFPDVLADGTLEKLVAAVRPELCERVWAEPFNDRANWKLVRGGYQPGSAGYDWFTKAFGSVDHGGWSAYARDLYQRLRAQAETGGWLDRLRYLLYEHHVADEHVDGFGDLRGILLQSKPREDGRSQHPGFEGIQRLSAFEA